MLLRQVIDLLNPNDARIKQYYIPTNDNYKKHSVKIDKINFENVDDNIKKQTNKNLEELNKKIIEKIKELDDEKNNKK